MKSKYLFSLFLLLLAACGPLPHIVVTPAATASPAFTPIPALTPAPPTPAPVATAAALPASSTVLVDVSADNVVLRSGPGTLFPFIRTMNEKETLTAFGRAPGDDWLFVKTSNDQAGWVSASFVTIASMEMGLLAEIQPGDVLVIHGSVKDKGNNPISGVGFALTQGQARDDATTNTKGNFYFYLPRSASGTWLVGFVSLDCASNIRIGDCSCPTSSCGQPDPAFIKINLPAHEEMMFTWK